MSERSGTVPPRGFRPVVVGALYPAVERGLAADIVAVRALGGTAFPVCTLMLMATDEVVTDATDVPEDTVRAQLEHISAAAEPTAMKIGVLANHAAARSIFAFADAFEGPVLLDLKLSEPSGATVLTSRGIETVLSSLSIPDLIVINHTDAEPISGGEISSLDDAQVAAQRIVRRGARAVVIKCGTLPARFFETENGHDAVGATEPFDADLFFDGKSFALFEAPHVERSGLRGASSAFALAALRGIASGHPIERAVQEAKRYVADGLRAGVGDAFDHDAARRGPRN